MSPNEINGLKIMWNDSTVGLPWEPKGMHFDGNGTLYKCSNPDYQEDGMNFFIILQNLREIKSDDFGASKIGNFDNLSKFLPHRFYVKSNLMILELQK